MKYKLMNLPNIISFSRMILAILIVFLIYYDNLHYALIVFIIAAATDYFDGLVAKSRKKENILGEFIDGLSDKVLIILTVFALFIKLDMPWYVLFILTRDIYLIVLTMFIFRKKNLDLTHIIESKILTVFQIITIIMIILRRHYLVFYIIALILTIPTIIKYTKRNI